MIDAKQLAGNLLLMLAMGLVTACVHAQPKTSTASVSVHILTPPLNMPGLDRQRTIRVYLPPGYQDANRRFPVLYMHDGQNLFDAATSYAGEWGVDESMDALAKSHALELIVVGIDNGQEKRMSELSPWPNERFGIAEGDKYMDFVVKTVKPFIDARYRTKPDREHTGIMGSSMGGLISHYAIHRYSDTFSKAGIFSPSYWYSSKVYDFTKANPLPSDARLYLLAGGKEGQQTADDMNRMVALMREARKGQPIYSAVVPEGKHNEAFWRTEFPKAVVWLFEEKR